MTSYDRENLCTAIARAAEMTSDPLVLRELRRLKARVMAISLQVRA